MSELSPALCQQCGGDVHRSRARSLVERMRRNFTEKRLYRCSQCGWRGWLVPLENMSPAAPGTAAQIDLSELDVELPGRTETREVFMPRDLQ